MQTLDAHDEQELLEAVKTAVELVDEQGLLPTAAVEKVARDGKLGPGKIRAVGYAYNTGRQTRQRETHTSVLDKLASFLLVDPEAVISNLYQGQPVKQATDQEYSRPPDWLAESKQRRLANTPLAMTKQAEAPAAGSLHALHKAYGSIQRQKKAAEELGRQKTAAEDRLRLHVAELVGYFRKSAYDRLPFAAVEEASLAYFGPDSNTLFDSAHGLARCHEKRAADSKPAQLAIDLKREPFTIVADCIKTAAQVHQARQLYQTATTKLAAGEKEALRPFGQSPVPSEHRGVNLFDEPTTEPTVKAAIMESPALGAAVGTMLSRGIGNVPKTKDDLVEDAWMDLEDPQHQNEIRKIRAHVLLNGMMTDSEDPISGFEPDRVLHAYNEIAQMAPRIAEQPAALRPILRRRLQGQVEPFEAKEITDIEKGLAQTKLPTPDSSLLSGGPDNLLG